MYVSHIFYFKDELAYNQYMYVCVHVLGMKQDYNKIDILQNLLLVIQYNIA